VKDHLRSLVRDRQPLQARNVAREYLQARILAALQRAGAMTSIAFCGGTCLRFLYNLPRYSEDLDFTLDGARAHYDLRRYLRAVRTALASEGYEVLLRLRDDRAVHGAFVRFPGVLHEIGLSPHPSEALAVRIEVDTRPPTGAATETTLVRKHETLRLFHHDRASLLAGKLHAILQRPYAKGRDVHDLIWYLSDPEWPAPNLSLLSAALEQTAWSGEAMTPATWRAAVAKRMEALDWPRIVDDVAPFLERSADLDLLTRNHVMGLLGTKS